MFFDYYLRFQDEAEAKSILYRKEGVVFDEEGNITDEGYDVPNFDNIDIIGTIYEPSGDTEEVDGVEVPIMVALDGFHANVRNYTATDLLNNYLVHPKLPRRVWA